MRKDLKRGGLALVMAVLTMAVSLAERAQAQQSGLFPLAPIRRGRERPPCPEEDPVYKYYKQQYFGYHYTCWRPFPAGWGCPSKQTADKVKEYVSKPLGRPPEMEEGSLPPEGDRGRQPSPDQPLPTPPNRDPFDMDAAPPGGQPPRPAPRPGGGRSPFDTMNPGASLSPSRRNPRTRTVSPSQGDDAPELSAPMGQPEQDAAARSTRGDSDDEAVARGDSGPVLNVEDLDAPRYSNAAPLYDSQPVQPTVPDSTNQPPPPRRGLISNLFGSLGLNWMRR